MNNTNVWKTIPLEDYEKHMQHPDVWQAQLLNELVKKYIQQHEPEYLLFLGISGGNGLEHINTAKIKEVCGVDINSSFLEITRKRFSGTIPQLHLVNADIGTSDESFIKADFVWAALVLEYVPLANAFHFIKNNTAHSAKVIITIQSDNGKTTISPTGVKSIHAVKDAFNTVEKEVLITNAQDFGFELIGMDENILPNGKSFITCAFVRT
ncbi:MAG: class I SAM-dependent methyltransferase [Niabella sp.]